VEAANVIGYTSGLGLKKQFQKIKKELKLLLKNLPTLMCLHG
jgi:hypothetical protein